MIESEFKEHLERLNEYYGLERTVSPGRFRQWLTKVRDIPAEALEYIYAKITDDKDTIPRNVPKHMRDYYHQWQSSTDKIIEYPRTDCSECHGHGLIWAKRVAMHEGKPMQGNAGDIIEEVSYRCAMCENWKRHCHYKAKEAASKRDLLERGYRIVDMGVRRHMQPVNVKQAAAAVGVPL